MSDSAPPVPPVAANVNAEIARLGLTNDEVARRLDVPERLVRRWRKGEYTPSWPNLVNLAEICEREPGWFYLDHSTDPEEVAA